MVTADARDCAIQEFESRSGGEPGIEPVLSASHKVAARGACARVEGIELAKLISGIETAGGQFARRRFVIPTYCDQANL